MFLERYPLIKGAWRCREVQMMEETFFHLKNMESEEIAVFTLDRPPVNALNFLQINALLDSIIKKADDRAIKIMLLTGKGRALHGGV
jgi:enoyl-CoA hydratase/carnithine racemase